jgi:hypothetical protein
VLAPEPVDRHDLDTIAIGIAISRSVGLAGSVANSSVATDVAATDHRAPTSSPRTISA